MVYAFYAIKKLTDINDVRIIRIIVEWFVATLITQTVLI